MRLARFYCRIVVVAAARLVKTNLQRHRFYLSPLLLKQAEQYRPKPMESLDRVLGPFEGVGTSQLIATLPQNSVDYALKAQESGASAVMVGLEKTELAFPGLFAGIDNQEQSVREILSTISIPVGVSIGEARPLTKEGWEAVVSLPFRF